ncbi:GSCOCG00012503001-RA-CDS [Cotesia congregata]|nr:GSCOCG00012503001-RA-CDS [Cotesia congregata]
MVVAAAGGGSLVISNLLVELLLSELQLLLIYLPGISLLKYAILSSDAAMFAVAFSNGLPRDDVVCIALKLVNSF